MRSRCVLTALAVTVVPHEGSGAVSRPAKITALSYVAIDGATGRVLVQKGGTVRRPIASLTKVMTALVVAERGELGGA